MVKINHKVKFDLFNFLKTQNFYGSSDSLLAFVNWIWPLRAMPSQDERFSNAYEDVIQHTVNNDDWSLDYLFQERFDLLNSDDAFNKFIEAIVNPHFRSGQDDIIRFVVLINPYLEKEGYALAISEYDTNGLPIYTIQNKEDVDKLPVDIKSNTIPFFVVKNPTGRADRRISHNTPTVFPSFVLAFNDGWNDYSVKSIFYLYYYPNANAGQQIGQVKIINDKEDDTSTEIPNEFLSLDENFCSLGQSFTYYQDLKTLLGNDFESVLFALNDAIFNADILEKYERTSRFRTSILRNDGAERLLREVKYQLNGYDLSSFLYKFKYAFKPPYAEQSIDIDFDFDNSGELPNRIFALIGKNGTGKTQLITSLPMKIFKKDNESFVPKVPLFSKVIAVSYSIFDTFDIPKKTSSFNYAYCGLRNDKGDIMEEKGLILRFHSTWKKIEALERINKWRNILLNFIEEDILAEFLVPREEITSHHNSYAVNIEGFHKVRRKLSSGQSIVLFIITEIVAHIRYDSLIIYDEPETHLHPNAITKLMNTIYELVNEFQSYCIIATHSPLVIRELFSRNVLVMERDENVLSVRRIGIESFGENISNLTEVVFGNKNVPKQYKKIIEALINEGKSPEEIINLLEFDDTPLSLNARLYIQSLAPAQ
jgi:energy-coupling factor transporter ATP-binding protein EcfA2